MRFRILAPLFLSLAALAQAPTWQTDLDAAKATAAQENKRVLVDFTGSTWCPYCVLLNNEVLETPEFAAFAKSYVLVKLDYPTRSGRTEEKIKADPNLAKLMQWKDAYKVSGFPTVVILSPSGQELGRQSGYGKGTGMAAYLGSFPKAAVQ